MQVHQRRKYFKMRRRPIKKFNTAGRLTKVSRIKKLKNLCIIGSWTFLIAKQKAAQYCASRNEAT